MTEVPGQQGSEAWHNARAGVVTASELHLVLTNSGDFRSGDGPHSYLCRKLAERWLGKPIDTGSSFAMEQGSILETEAIPWFELRFNADVKRVGFLLADDRRFGCSPDGLIAPNTGLEIKCPQPTNHMEYLLNGGVPNKYVLQLQGAMYVTGAQEWTFLSYHREFPPLIAVARRDSRIMDAIAAVTEKIEAEMRKAIKLLEMANGGPRTKTTRAAEAAVNDDGTQHPF